LGSKLPKLAEEIGLRVSIISRLPLPAMVSLQPTAATSFMPPLQGQQQLRAPASARMDAEAQFTFESLMSALVFLRDIHLRLKDADEHDIIVFDCFEYQLEAEPYLRDALHVVMHRFNIKGMDVEVMRDGFQPSGEGHHNLYDRDEHSMFLFRKHLDALERWLNKVKLMKLWDRTAALEFVYDVVAIQSALPTGDASSNSSGLSSDLLSSLLSSVTGSGVSKESGVPLKQKPWSQRRLTLPIQFAVARSIDPVLASAPLPMNIPEGYQPVPRSFTFDETCTHQ